SNFALVLALVVWLRLGAQVTIYSAEINTVLNRHLWPRSLFGPPESPADQETRTTLAKVEERDQIEQVDVSFQNGDGSSPESAPPASSEDAPAPSPETVRRKPTQ
ncbi:MAG: hypothetical protein JO244_09805, partial [Solirubrobacterales bacterium]|nr:hypothetical protein [Solirubrobacterales bacterium]